MTVDQQIKALSAAGKGQLEIIGILRQNLGMTFGEANRTTHAALNLRQPTEAEKAADRREQEALKNAARAAGIID